VELNVPDGIADFELIDENKTVIPHEFLSSGNLEKANLFIKKESLRDTLGAITEGRVAGAALIHIKVSRQGAIVTIDAVLDDQAQPNITEWHQAEEDIAKYETDPTVMHFHVIAHTPRASKIRFVSPPIQAFGWRTIWARALSTPGAAPAAEISPLLKPFLPLALSFAQTDLGEKFLAKQDSGAEKGPPYRIENEYFLVEASHADGTLTITDKQTHAIFTGLNRFVDGGDAGDEYNYSPPSKDSFSIPKVVSLSVFHQRLIPSLEIKFALQVPARLSSDRKSRSKKLVRMLVKSRISLAPGVPRVDVQTEVDNLAKDHRLRVHFHAPFTVQAADYDGHFEVVRRPIGVPQKGENWFEEPRPEVPQRAFTDVTDGKIGLMIANRGLPEVEVIPVDGMASTEIALTLLRCVGWLSRDDMPGRLGHAGPGLETPGGQVPGKWRYDYAILPHQGDWRQVYQQAYAFEISLRATETGLHAGELPAQGAFISHSPVEFIISAVKEAENGQGWIVRGYNLSDKTIQLNLRTMRRFTNAMQVNLAEEEITGLDMGDEGGISMPVCGHEVVGIQFFEKHS
jgi:alpha-mannosidase